MGNIKWTREQLQAIKTKGNNLLVAAAAGSGKTAVLVERVIYKILHDKIDVDQLLVVTFTNAAASEMRERILEAIYKKLEEEPENEHLQKQIGLISRANICTIDAFCLEIVKNYFYEIDCSPNFRILDTAELELMKQEVLEDLLEQKYEKEDTEFLSLLETYTTYSSDEPLKDLIQNIHNFLQSNPFPQEWLEKQVEKYNLQDIHTDFVETIWGSIIFSQLKEELLDAKLQLQQLKKNMVKFPEIAKFMLVIDQDIQLVETILQCKNWDNLYQVSSTCKFEKWPVDKKITLGEKELAKEKRDAIKAQVKKILEKIDCTSMQALEDIKAMYPILKSIEKIIIEYETLLKQAKKEKDVVDFSDVEHMALEILLQKDEKGAYVPTEVAKKYQQKFVEIAIDEYQDSNLVQESILTSISKDNNIFMVGDVKQSIYKFRQARPELFLKKYENYAPVEESILDNKGSIIQLFQNFRSRKNILDTTNLIFANIMSKALGEIDYTKKEYLNLGASFDETKEDIIGTPTEIVLIENNKETEQEITEEPVQNIELEAKWVAKKIKEFIAQKKKVWDKKIGYRPITYRDMVILLRSTKDKATAFETELANQGIPVYSDSSMEYLNSIEIQTIMNLLKVIDNSTVDIPLVSVLRSEIGDFTDNELMQIRLNSLQGSFYDAMQEYITMQENSLKEKIQNFFAKVNKWRKEAEYLALDELIWNIYLETGYYHYSSLMPDGILRQANLKLLFEKAKQYVKTNSQGLYHFIRFIEKVKNSSNDLSAAKLIGENEDVVRIMSIHKSKGLEFPLVFLCNAQKKCNMQDLNSPIIIHQDLGLGANYIDSKRKLQYDTFAKEAIQIQTKKEIISEEMRILYVALTRAKEKLIITGVVQNIEENLQEKEQILEAYKEDKYLPPQLIKKHPSYLDWIELVYLKNKEKDILELKKIKMEDILAVEENVKKEIKIPEEFISNAELKRKEEILTKLNWQYSNKELTKIEGNTSVSKVKNIETEKGLETFTISSPLFMQEQNRPLTPTQKGTLLHLCMQNLNVKEEYTLEKINKLIETLQLQKKITQVEANNINVNAILHFVKSNIFQELRNAKLVEREKPFYIYLPANEIMEVSTKEKILVQGVIDLFYINQKGELILVDYKTDYIQQEQILIERYKKQLDLYKQALEEALSRRVDKIYIYSTSLNKAINVN